MDGGLSVSYYSFNLSQRASVRALRRRRERLRRLTVTVILSVIALIAVAAAWIVIWGKKPAAEPISSPVIVKPIIVPLPIRERPKAAPAVIAPPPFPEIARIPGVPRVILDPGHGGIDDGCVRAGVLEKNVNMEITRLLERELAALGYQVIFTRTGDDLMTVEERVEKANYYQADIFVSIHQNSYEGAEAKGIETWYQGEDTGRDNEGLATAIHKQAISGTGAADRALIDQSELYVTNNTVMPACLIETGFLSSQAERTKLVSREYQEQLAAGIAQGIREYLTVKQNLTARQNMITEQNPGVRPKEF